MPPPSLFAMSYELLCFLTFSDYSVHLRPPRERPFSLYSIQRFDIFQKTALLSPLYLFQCTKVFSCRRFLQCAPFFARTANTVS